MIRPEAMQLILRPIAIDSLREEFTSDEAAQLIDRAFVGYAASRVDVPDDATKGASLMVHLAALTAALYREVLNRRPDEAEARRITARVTWAGYEKMASLPGFLAKLRGRAPLARLKAATSLFRRFPFGPPSYVMEDVDAGPEVVAFDVKRCPVAQYFRSQGLSQLCVESWCNLDFPLARKWGGRLERAHTIAEGHDRCDFRWRADTPPEPVED